MWSEGLWGRLTTSSGGVASTVSVGRNQESTGEGAGVGDRRGGTYIRERGRIELQIVAYSKDQGSSSSSNHGAREGKKLTGVGKGKEHQIIENCHLQMARHRREWPRHGWHSATPSEARAAGCGNKHGRLTFGPHAIERQGGQGLPVSPRERVSRARHRSDGPRGPNSATGLPREKYFPFSFSFFCFFLNSFLWRDEHIFLKF